LYEKPKRGRRKSDAPPKRKNLFDEDNIDLTPEEINMKVTCGVCDIEMPKKK